MNKIASYLQAHIAGEVVDSAEVRQHFATDGSVLEVMPSLAVYPRNTNDVRKVARFVWQLAEKGHRLPITARGLGSNQTGAAIGKGVVLALPAHMNGLLELDPKQHLVRVQPGLSCLVLQEVAGTHALRLPTVPATGERSTIGGMIADDYMGEHGAKYGSVRSSVDSLEVVLANGELIQTKRISKHELNRRKGYTSFEGSIYRELDNLITDNWELLQQYVQQASMLTGSSGYALADVKRRDGSFDLTPLFVGSQGTLGIISEAIIRLEPVSSHTTVVAAYFNELEAVSAILPDVLVLKPTALEVLDRHFFEQVKLVSPARLKDQFEQPYPAAAIIVEFDDQRGQQHKVKKATKLLSRACESYYRAEDPQEQDKLWAIRRSATEIIVGADTAHALPIIAGGVVSPDALPELFSSIYELLHKQHTEALVWYSASSGLHIWPMLDLTKIGDRQKVFKITDEYYELLAKLNGTLVDGGDGRLRAPYLAHFFGPELAQVLTDAQHIFDPYSTLNPGVKVGSSKTDLTPLLRRDYTAPNLYDYLPSL